MKLILFAYYIMIFDEINFHNFAANDLNYSNCPGGTSHATSVEE